MHEHRYCRAHTEVETGDVLLSQGQFQVWYLERTTYRTL